MKKMFDFYLKGFAIIIYLLHRYSSIYTIIKVYKFSNYRDTNSNQSAPPIFIMLATLS